MKRTVLVMLISIVTVAGFGSAAEVRPFGQPLDPELELTPIETIVSDPDAWLGKVVKIQGRVSGVCTLKGCWMDLVSPQDTTLRVKVDDGDIVFPEDATGSEAIAEGEVEILDMERDAYEGWQRHVAQEEGRAFDPATLGEPPYRVVRLRGRGAEIQGP